MRKWMVLALALALFGAMGCSGSAGKDNANPTDKGTEAPKTTEQGKSAEGPKPADPAKPAEGAKIGESEKPVEPPVAGPTPTQSGKPTTATTPAGKGKDAKQPAVSEKSGSYLGTYAIVVTAEMKKLAQAKLEEVLARVPEKDRAKARSQANMMMDSMSKMELTFLPGGKYKVTGMPGAPEVTGTYTAKGNTLEVTSPSKPGLAPTTQTLTYDPKAQTLTGKGGGTTTVFKKK